MFIDCYRYTIMLQKLDSKTDKVVGLQTTHGYFKLDHKGTTKLDLRSYEKSRVKWLYFNAIKPQNPQNRAWLHAIRGPAFGSPYLHCESTLLTLLLNTFIFVGKRSCFMERQILFRQQCSRGENNVSKFAQGLTPVHQRCTGVKSIK